jgi:hypothetical protein
LSAALAELKNRPHCEGKERAGKNKEDGLSIQNKTDDLNNKAKAEDNRAEKIHIHHPAAHLL